MGEFDSKPETFIFFLRLTGNLPPFFFHLGQEFLRFNITLIPVSLVELVQLSKGGGSSHVIVVVNNLQSYKVFLNYRKKFLDFALLSSKFFLSDISSFEEIQIDNKVRKNKSYGHFRLPMSVEAITMKISTSYYSQNGSIKKWPGGNRVKL